MSKKENEVLLARIDEALNDVRPHLVFDGGNVEVVDITDEHVVIIKWLGNCESCFMSAMTMKAGIEETLKNKIPEVTGVEAINGVEI